MWAWMTRCPHACYKGLANPLFVMAKRKDKPKATPKDKPFNNPFTAVGKAMKKELRKNQKEEKKAELRQWAKPKTTLPQDEAPPASDEDLFAAAVRGSDRMNDPRGTLTPALPPGDAGGLAIYDEEAESLAELASLVDGSGQFDISDTDEFIEGCMEGLDRRILRKLKRGDFSHRSHLDLHGMQREEARKAVEQFLTEKRTAGHRCVLIVHGRGHNSKDQIPILKGLLQHWMERGRISKSVLAFCTARPNDGGAGAMYVLLRKWSP